MKEEVPASLAGERVDKVVALMTGLARAAVSDVIDAGGVLVDGKPVKTRSVKLEEGQTVEVEVPEANSNAPLPDAEIAFEVLHADDDVIVLNKPAGLVVHPGSGNETGTLVNGLLARFPDMAQALPGDSLRPGIVHRLDAGTSGILIVARTQRSYDALVSMMKAREVERRYVTLVWGNLQPDRGMIDAPIGRSERDRTKMAVASGGRAARTHYEVLQHFEDPEVTYVDVKLDTGRTHQIRVHFAAIEHAVVGDVRYRGRRGAIDVPRPFLHACSLDFVHPFTNEQMHFDAPLPADLQAILDSLT